VLLFLKKSKDKTLGRRPKPRHFKKWTKLLTFIFVKGKLRCHCGEGRNLLLQKGNRMNKRQIAACAAMTESLLFLKFQQLIHINN